MRENGGGSFRSLLQHVLDVVAVLEADGTLRYVSPAIEPMLGYTPEEVIDTSVFDYVHRDDLEKACEALAETLMASGALPPLEFRARRADGYWRFVEVVLNNRLDDPNVKGVVINVRDVTERKRAEETLRLRNRALSATSDGIIITDTQLPDNPIVYVNSAFERITGYEAEEALGRNCRFLQGSDRNQLVLQRLGRTLREGKEFRGVLRNYKKDGSLFYNELKVTPVLDDEGRIVNFVGIQTDVTSRIRAERALKESEARYRTMVEQQTELVCRFASGLILTFANEAYCRYFGRSLEELVGKCFLDHIPEADRFHYEAPTFQLSAETPTRTVEHRVITPDRGVRWQQWTDTAIFDAEGRVIEYQSVGRDITERKVLEERMEHRALHDSLTELPNRLLFVERLKQALRRTKRSRHPRVAVLFMDLDRFKVVNDSLGHVIGDRLLVAVAERLKGHLRSGDTLSRFGGDEFVVLLEDIVGPDEPLKVARRITEELNTPFEMDGRELYARSSIGIALGGDDGSREPDDLLRNADAAMYRAKEEGLDYAMFDPAMYRRAMGKLRVENDLKRAVERQEFAVHYQPMVDLRTGKIPAVEALVRWEHPERGLLAPSEFVTAAEESGLVIQMDKQVLRTACFTAKNWQSRHPRVPPLTVSVNLSAKQLSRPDLARTVEALLEETGLDGSCLTLDVTETAYVKVHEVNTKSLDRLKRLGVRVSIDDFGMGYSSLSYLKRLPADALKIDKSFVRSLGEDPQDTVLVQMIIELAHTLGMEVIAEGVETAEQAVTLKEMGCDFGQGFHYSKPLPADEMSEYLAR